VGENENPVEATFTLPLSKSKKMMGVASFMLENNKIFLFR
jgi:hypothetical protein